jgi:hypothetical protein
VHHPLPGVGHNFQDHYIARMSCEVRRIETMNERGRGLSFASELWRYVTTGTGMLTYSASLCAASVSDFSVCTTWGVSGKHLFLLGVFRRRLEYPALKRAVREQQRLFDATEVLIEDKASGTQLIQELIEDGCHGVTRYQPTGDKIMRLQSRTIT